MPSPRPLMRWLARSPARRYDHLGPSAVLVDEMFPVRTQCALAMIVALAASACAQAPVSPAIARIANQWFDHLPAAPPLDCKLKIVKPFLDFSFRFESGYVVNCPMRQFGGKKNTLDTFVRVSPEGAPPRLLGISHEVPGEPSGMPLAISKFNADARFSGGFSLGEGQYEVSLLVRDDLGRFFERRWKISAAPAASEKATPIALPHGEVAPVGAGPSKLAQPVRNGLRLVILLDAEPTSGVPSELRPWDRVLLLQLVSSLLRDTRWSSVRLIAFNLAQERQIFTDDAFNESGFAPLSRALTNLDLATIPYQAIEPGAMEHFLVRLIDGASKGGAKPPGAVVIIGPVARLSPVNPQVLPRPAEDQKAPLFYFQYFSNWLSRQHLPDAIAVLTTAWGGTVFNIDSPAGLAQAISKFEAMLNPNKS